MLSHVFIGITDFDRALAFYQPIMDALKLQMKFCDPGKPWAAWMSKDAPRPLFVIGTAFDEQPATPGNGQMIALLASSREIVNRLSCTGHGSWWILRGATRPASALSSRLLRRLHARPGRQQTLRVLPRTRLKPTS